MDIMSWTNNNAENDLREAAALTTLPTSVLGLPSDLRDSLLRTYWIQKCNSHPEFKLLKPKDSETLRPLYSFSPRIANELEQLVTKWRIEAQYDILNMSETKRRKILDSIGVESFSEEHYLRYLPTKTRTPSPSCTRNRRALSTDSFTSSTSAASCSSFPDSNEQLENNSRFLTGCKRKAMHLSGSRRIFKVSKVDNYSRKFKKFKPNSAHKRKKISKACSDVLDENFDIEDDSQLSVVHRKQRQGSSTRVPAARGSSFTHGVLNDDTNHTTFNGDYDSLHPIITKIPPRTQLPHKVLRAWKSLVKKVVCKVARQRIGYRRDRIALAKRAARECARLLRQRALISQKFSKDSSTRGHRLAREIATNLRNAAMNSASGNDSLVINGIIIPSNISLSKSIEFPEFCSVSGASDPNNTTSTVTANDHYSLLVDSNLSLRRRAEKAAAEQRRADLELLEARRQQRKLNFLITQTELYAHFMAKKMSSQTVLEKHSAEETIADKNEVDLNLYEPETRQILSRLEEPDNINLVGSMPGSNGNEESVNNGNYDNKQALDTTNVDINADPTNKRSRLMSSVAAAAQAAAYRLGINDEDDYNYDKLKIEAIRRVEKAVEKETLRVSEFQPSTWRRIDDRLSQNLEGSRNSVSTSIASNATLVKASSLFKGQLKAYQIRGLNWLLSLFDQGINGILADEMGLGKTIQTIAFLGCLAESYNIWGPFLIVTPASTLHNWTQEFAKFLPTFRLVPYWGTPAERKVLRRFWSSNLKSDSDETCDSEFVHSHTSANSGQTGLKNSELHVVITSYQVVLQDAKFINKTAWSYIVLDEAHAIKSTSSLRWRILLSFKCRNRLLLTGTPIQNTMHELWALLHFIMPTLFDSHDEFANWFSRDIESQASASAGANSSSIAGGPLVTTKLNENQLSRLHLILKPFMLRRTKAEVEHEISSKTEIMLYCSLSRRQQALYERLRNKIRLEDLNTMMFSANGNSDLADKLGANSATTAHLINLVMQLRKVCNHPDLLERRDVKFSCFLGQISPTSNNLCQQMGDRQTGYWSLPKRFVNEDILFDLIWYPTDCPLKHLSELASRYDWFYFKRSNAVARFFDIFQSSYICSDLWHNYCSTLTESSDAVCIPRFFSFLRLMGLSIREFLIIHKTVDLRLLFKLNARLDSMVSILILKKELNEPEEHAFNSAATTFCTQSLSLRLAQLIPMCFARTSSDSVAFLEPLGGFILPIHEPLSYKYIPSVVVQSTGCRPFLPDFVSSANLMKVLIRPIDLYVNLPAHLKICKQTFKQSQDDFWTKFQMVPRSIATISHASLISDSGKLTALDALLTDLKAGGHRVLIYSQMTRMIDILEEFMLYRKHAYLRLDGSSRLSDRRDMVAQWQNNPRWFVFLLSTRAGGLGINLTAADTVIFYDSDWNPTVDQQAMDRAHRLGQTKPVMVYRLICKNTVEGRMLRRAEEKRAMQHMVIQSNQSDSHGNLLSSNTNPSATSGKDHMTSSEMVSLLLDDDELVKRLQVRRRLQPQRGRPAKNQAASRIIASTSAKRFNSNALSPSSARILDQPSSCNLVTSNIKTSPDEKDIVPEIQTS